MTPSHYLPSLFGISLEVYVIIFILGVPLFFFYRWLFNKLINNKKTRIIVTWLATLISSPLVYFAIVLLWFFSMSYYPTHEFNQAKWRSDVDHRYEMSKNLIESKMLIGKTKTEIKLMLGDDGNSEQQDVWSYFVGYRPGLNNIDPDILVIEFKDNKVIEVIQRET